jgi:hypothetical protein
MILARRFFFGLAPLTLIRSAAAQPTPVAVSLPPEFPTQPAELAREMVGASHADLNRVRELLQLHPSLAKASWDWAFGDWETALGAACHTGNQPIARLLLEHGAPPTIFSATMLGQLDVVKAMIAAQPGVQRFAGPHSISLLAHASAGGAGSKPVLDYLMSLGDADQPAEQPLSEAQLRSVVGVYAFGPAPIDRIDINTNNSKQQLRFFRIGTSAHRLIHRGNLTFHPAGAPAVRIVFDGAKRLTVHDPDPILTAERI